MESRAITEAAVRDFKRRLILRTLRECGGRKTEIARTLRVARSYLHRLMNQLQIPCVDVLADESPRWSGSCSFVTGSICCARRDGGQLIAEGERV